MPVLCGLSRPRVANLRLDQQRASPKEIKTYVHPNDPAALHSVPMVIPL